MDSNIKISVVIPAFNASETIIRCVESVLQQSLPIYEIIVINDGSTDNTTSLLSKFKERNNLQNLHIINQSNGGPAKARNQGIINAKGNWIAFLDSDDRWLPEKIAKQIEVISKYPECTIIGTYFFTDNKKGNNTHPQEITFTKMLFKNRLYTSTVLVKKEIISQYYFDEAKKHIGTEDYKLWLQIIHSNMGLVICDGLAIYADNSNKYKRNALSNNLYKMEKGILSIYYFLFRKGMINILTLVIIVTFSLLKYLRILLLFYLSKLRS